MIKVYFYSKNFSRLVATFVDKEAYTASKPALQKLAWYHRCEVAGQDLGVVLKVFNDDNVEVANSDTLLDLSIEELLEESGYRIDYQGKSIKASHMPSSWNMQVTE